MRAPHGRAVGMAAEETIMKRLTAANILGLASLFFAVNPAVAQTDAKVTARDVVDRASLKAFVLEAREYLDSFETLSGYRDALESFRAGGAWKQGSVYLYVGTPDGVVVFHAVDPDLEGRDLYDLEDSNGVKIMQELLSAAAEGGGYVEYLWDDPAVAGDEETGSPKVGYAVPYTALGEEFILGSGFYPGSASTAVAGRSWGRLKVGLVSFSGRSDQP